jgi:arsenical pump membrane protein
LAAIIPLFVERQCWHGACPEAALLISSTYESHRMIHWPAASPSHLAAWAIAGLATAAVIVRPGRLPEAVWAALGALALLLFGLLPLPAAIGAVIEGWDVYLFLMGMMLLSELARREGLFDTLAAWAVRHADGSARRLFGLVFGIGAVVTVFMSNDATAVVLTPAVYVVAKRAGARPLPYLFACAFVANAASFVLPISNPANLVVFGEHMPPLLAWVRAFALPSVAAVVVTWAALAFVFRTELAAPVESTSHVPALSGTGRLAAAGIAGVVLAMLAASALGFPLGTPTLLATLLAIAAVQATKRESPLALLQHVSWSVLMLVAGLFVLVAGVGQTGLIAALSEGLRTAAHAAPRATAWGAGALVACASNLMNNLPAGLIAGTAANSGPLPGDVRSAIAIGIDLGPNLSVTGSLATILWLVALRREGETVSAWQFLRVGALVMPLALVAALACT